MEQPNNEQTEISAHIAEAKEIKGEREKTVSFGKFKDAEALLAAYNSLQSEFTKRCQRIKELEAATALASDTANADNPELSKTGITEQEKEDLLKTGDAKANEVLKYFYKGFLSEEEKHRLVVKIWTEVKKDVEKDLKSIIGAGNDLYTMIDS